MNLADELRGLMERATPGEHVLDERPGVRYSVNVGSRHVALFSYYKEKQSDEDENIANTKLYILLRNNLPAILEALGGRDALQAKIDALMLEYCPDEMTAEQMENWGKHQSATKGHVTGDSVVDSPSAVNK